MEALRCGLGRRLSNRSLRSRRTPRATASLSATGDPAADRSLPPHLPPLFSPALILRVLRESPPFYLSRGLLLRLTFLLSPSLSYGSEDAWKRVGSYSCSGDDSLPGVRPPTLLEVLPRSSRCAQDSTASFSSFSSFVQGAFDKSAPLSPLFAPCLPFVTLCSTLGDTVFLFSRPDLSSLGEHALGGNSRTSRALGIVNFYLRE